MKPGILGSATWTLGKSRLEGGRGCRKRVISGLLYWASLGLSTQQKPLSVLSKGKMSSGITLKC